MREHQAMVFRTLLRLTGSREHVDDLALMNKVVADVSASTSVPAPGSWLPGTWYALN